MANKASKIAKTATEALKILWEQGFFRSWRKKGVIEQHLSKAGYNFSGPELGMALKRAGHLTRKGKHGSYEYIQKYPFVAEKITQSFLKDKHQPDRWVGLAEMIDIAAREKLNGVPFLLSKTAKEIKGIKFLGDTAAHNPLASVDTKTILPQMPFIITAYEELAKRL